MLSGRMMPFPLTLTHFVTRVQTLFKDREVVSRTADGMIVRSSYGEVAERSRRLGSALQAAGIRRGDRVASLCWNHQQHLELYLGVPCSGAVLHTLNLRLHPNELAYIARHAEDQLVFVDYSLVPLWLKIFPSVPSVRHVVLVPDGAPRPDLPGAIDYETFLFEAPDKYEFPNLDENDAAIVCYTSGTTGNPKGVVYSHRSTTLHTLVSCMTDTLGVSQNDTILPVVPMFHANAWGLPYTAVCVGSKLVFPGPKVDPISLLDLMASEKVTIAAGVPTIWLGILAQLDENPSKWDLSAIRSMVIGGAAAPPSMIAGFLERHRLTVTHAWGMTETNPLGTLARLKHHLETKSPDEKAAARASQGYAVPFVELRHVADDGSVLPWNGETMGELEVRGPWVARSYFGDEGNDRFTADGWFKTGDVVTIDAEGYVRITDRAKDVIKSGGEWISSVALENALMSHPSVLEAAVFAAPHAKWSERPVAAIVLKPNKTATEEELKSMLETRFAKFWVPDAFVFISQIPRTSTGKFLKTKLRADHQNILQNRAE